MIPLTFSNMELTQHQTEGTFLEKIYTRLRHPNICSPGNVACDKNVIRRDSSAGQLEFKSGVNFREILNLMVSSC
jgi:hypothetical protein